MEEKEGGEMSRTGGDKKEEFFFILLPCNVITIFIKTN